MDSSDICRLCLDPMVKSFTSIFNQELRNQMEKVFCFSIEPKQGCYSGVCQSCSSTISEFYQYSEKVRQNQEVLNGSITKCEPTSESISFAVELLKEPEDEISLKIEPPDSDDNESCHDERPPEKSETKRKERPSTEKLDNADEDPSKSNKDAQQRRHKEDQLFNKHFPMICDRCGTSAATFTELKSHFWKKHKQRNGYIVCCNKKLFKRCAILEHIDFHDNPDKFLCALCGKKYKNKYTLNVHTLCMHSSEDQRPYKCHICSQSFALKTALARHMERHLQVKCPKCDKMFASKNSLSIHMTNLHSGKDRTKVCDTCGQGFLSKLSFDRHINEHIGIELQRFQCKICQRWLKGEINFRNHMKWVHTDGNREYQCDICLQKYPHSRALQAHKLQTHIEPKHECEFCGKKFKKAICLKEHRTTHTGEVLYSCDYCGISNNSMANMYQHIKRQHPTEYALKKQMATQKNGHTAKSILKVDL